MTNFGYIQLNKIIKSESTSPAQIQLLRSTFAAANALPLNSVSTDRGILLSYILSDNEQQARAILDSHRFSKEILLHDAELARSKHKYKAATLLFETVLGKDNGSFEGWLGLARSYAGQQLTDKAEAAFQAAFALDAEKSVLPFAQFYVQTERPVQGERLLQQLIDTYQNSSNLGRWQREVAVIQMEQGREAEAIATLAAAVAHKTADYDTYLLYAELLGRQQRYDEAVEILKIATITEPMRGGGYFAGALLLTKAGHIDEATAWLDEALQLSPNNRSWQLQFANQLRDQLLLERAEAVYASLIEDFPEEPAVYYEASYAYLLSGDLEQAAVLIENALDRQSPPLSKYYQRAGEIYEANDETDRAVLAFKEALLLNPNNQAASNALERLAK